MNRYSAIPSVIAILLLAPASLSAQRPPLSLSASWAEVGAGDLTRTSGTEGSFGLELATTLGDRWRLSGTWITTGESRSADFEGVIIDFSDECDAACIAPFNRPHFETIRLYLFGAERALYRGRALNLWTGLEAGWLDVSATPAVLESEFFLGDHDGFVMGARLTAEYSLGRIRILSGLAADLLQDRNDKYSELGDRSALMPRFSLGLGYDLF